MIKWYKEPYFDKVSWLLTNFEKINITADELVFVLLIDYAKKNKIKITYEYFNQKLNSTNEDVDNLIASLVSKKYLKIVTNEKGVFFDIDGLFEFDPNQYDAVVNKDIYETLADTFNRPLTPMELQKASDLIKEYGQNKFNDALRTAEAYKKVSMAYIEAVLKNEKN